MAKLFEEIDDKIRAFIEAQTMFFVATAPSGDEGHVNVSPKGGADLFRVTGPLGFSYVDLMGSGIETIAHLRENGRIAVMFCAFAGPPKIVRLHGHGTPIQQGDPGSTTRSPRSTSPTSSAAPSVRSSTSRSPASPTRAASSCRR